MKKVYCSLKEGTSMMLPEISPRILLSDTRPLGQETNVGPQTMGDRSLLIS